MSIAHLQGASRTITKPDMYAMLPGLVMKLVKKIAKLVMFVMHLQQIVHYHVTKKHVINVMMI